MGVVTRYPSSNSVVSGSWTDPTNVYSGSDAGAYGYIQRGTTKNSSDDIRYGTFGFDGQIPVGATINSVQIEVNHHVQGSQNVCYLECAVRVSSTDGTFNTDDTEPTTPTDKTYASQARPGGGGWTRSDLLNGTFEVTLRARNGNNASSNQWRWDYVRVTVDYSFTEDRSQPVVPCLTGSATFTRGRTKVSRCALLHPNWR